MGELKSKNGYTAFCDENQGVFVVAASDDPADTSTYAQGDAVLDDPCVEMTDTGVPLTECFVTTVLRETIMRVHDRYRLITPDSLNAALKLAKTGQTVNSRYIWPDSYCAFYLAKDVWFLDWDGMQFAAHRGLWKQPPTPYRKQIFEGGGGWTSRPENPTLMQRAEQTLSRLFKR